MAGSAGGLYPAWGGHYLAEAGNEGGLYLAVTGNEGGLYPTVTGNEGSFYPTVESSRLSLMMMAITVL